MHLDCVWLQRLGALRRCAKDFFFSFHIFQTGLGSQLHHYSDAFVSEVGWGLLPHGCQVGDTAGKAPIPKQSKRRETDAVRGGVCVWRQLVDKLLYMR